MLACARGRWVHHQETAGRIGKEGADDCCPHLKKGDDVSRPTIAEMDPDHLGRSAIQKTPLPEIVVLGDDTEVMGPGVFPNDRVVRASEAHVADMDPPGNRTATERGSRGLRF